jgi:transcriptional regulator GlxA family with amidase domain
MFADDDAPLTYRAPADPARLQTAVRAFMSAWDDDLTVKELAPFVEEVRRALEGRP